MPSPPPHNLQLEQTLLSTCMLDETGDTYTRVAPYMLDGAILYSPAHGHVWKAIGWLVERAQPVDPVLVVNRLKSMGRLTEIGGVAFVTHLTDSVASVTVVEQIARDLVRLYKLRQIIALSRKAIGEASSGQIDDVDQWLAQTADEYATVAQGHAHDSLRTLRQVVRGVVEQADVIDRSRKQGAAPGSLPSGYTELDKLIDGTNPGELYIVAGRPGMGKSAFALSWMTQVALIDYKTTLDYQPGCLFLSLEMENDQQAQRALAIHGGVHLRAIRGVYFTSDGAERSRFLHAAQKLSVDHFVLDDTPALTLSDVQAKIRKTKADMARLTTADGKPVVLRHVVIDYLQLMRGSKKSYGSREQEISEISRGLKEFAKRYKVTIIALSQLNRDLEKRPDKRPMLSDLRESGSIEQDADVVLFVYRDSLYNAPELDEAGNEPLTEAAEIIVAKQRGGATGTAYVSFVCGTTDFRDAPEDPAIARAKNKAQEAKATFQSRRAK